MNTPTPRTDKAAYSMGRSGEHRDIERWCDLLNESRKLEKELTAVTEQRDGLRSGIDYASDQLAKVTEQRDRLAEELKETKKHLKDANRGAEINAHALRINADKLTAVTEQRDRLAEALRKAISWGDSASHYILHRQDINWTYLNEAKEALQSLNEPEP